MKASFIREANENMEYETGMIVEVGDDNIIYGEIKSIRMTMDGNEKPRISYFILGSWWCPSDIKSVLKRVPK